jgi:cell division protein ZapA
MAQVTISIGGMGYDVACRDGEEDHLIALGAVVDKKAKEASNAVGSANEVRQLLFASLLLADELQELRTSGGNAGPAPAANHGAAPDLSTGQLDEIAERLEKLASRLENRSGNA